MEDRIVQRKEKKLFLDQMVNRDEIKAARAEGGGSAAAKDDAGRMPLVASCCRCSNSSACHLHGR